MILICVPLRNHPVETIGDCYVAVAGLPEPHKDHAIIMARFAHEISLQMVHLTQQLEVNLGPGTSDLCLRVGMHSGPVTAGVLRGEKYRFQLFGDTMNTASRMESTGKQRRIQVSEATADLLRNAGKANWLNLRDSPVYAKGKGKMQTYWLKIRRAARPENVVDRSLDLEMASNILTAVSEFGSGEYTARLEQPTREFRSRESRPRESRLWGQMTVDDSLDTDMNAGILQGVKEERLIDWNTDVLLRLLEKVVEYRLESGGGSKPRWTKFGSSGLSGPRNCFEGKTTVIEEVTEVIALPSFDPNSIKSKQGSSPPRQLPPEVRFQLREFVSAIAANYRDVPFHNFEHASHVTMSANKLMKRIIKPSDLESNKVKEGESKKVQRKVFAEDLHFATFGISSDPLTQFAVVFSALIHDVDHYGVPNIQLMKEKEEMASAFGNQSVAEQNSVVMAWDLLMEPRFGELQTCIFSNDEGRHRFRQLVVNTVMATDIMDRDLITERKNRWERTFAHNEQAPPDPFQLHTEQENVNRKATIVIEHIIQASDVAHTMQVSDFCVQK